MVATLLYARRQCIMQQPNMRSKMLRQRGRQQGGRSGPHMQRRQHAASIATSPVGLGGRAAGAASTAMRSKRTTSLVHLPPIYSVFISSEIVRHIYYTMYMCAMFTWQKSLKATNMLAVSLGLEDRAEADVPPSNSRCVRFRNRMLTAIANASSHLLRRF